MIPTNATIIRKAYVDFAKKSGASDGKENRR